MIDLTTQTAQTIAEAVRRRELTAVAVTQSALDRIARLNATLHSFITVTSDQALESAEAVDRQIAAGQGDQLPLAGVPMAIKDSFWTKGVRTTGGTKILAEFVPSEDATAVSRLKTAGCVLVGKSLMHEMAYGFTSRNPHYGDCRNPWDTSRIPGGSSGGNAAALATGMALAAVGRRHRRLKPPARRALWNRRRQNYLWPSQPAWRAPALLVNGYRRTDGAHRGRCRGIVAGDGRARSPRSDDAPRPRSGLCGHAQRWAKGAATRCAAQ